MQMTLFYWSGTIGIFLEVGMWPAGKEMVHKPQEEGAELCQPASATPLSYESSLLVYEPAAKGRKGPSVYLPLTFLNNLLFIIMLTYK